MSPMVILGVLLAISVAGNGLLAKLYVGAKEDLAAEKQAYASFKAQVQVQGEKAAREAKAKDDENKKRKEDSDAEYKKSLAGLTSELGRLRADSKRSARGRLPEAPANTRCPQGWACYDRAELGRAYGSLVEGVRTIADEGTTLSLRMDTALRWAQTVR